MSRITVGILAAAALGSASILSTAANAGCGCNREAAYVPPAPVYYAQPAPTVVTIQPAPIVVQIGTPQVTVQQAYQAPVQTYQVNQGPYYSGPGADYSPAVYQPAEPVLPHPYVRSYRWRSSYGPHHPRPFVKAWRHHNRYAVHHGPAARKFYKH